MIQYMMMVALIFLVGAPLLIYTLGPFIIWKTQKIPTIVKFQALDEAEFLMQQNEAFRKYVQSLEQQGFRSVGASVLKDIHAKSYFKLYWHHKTRVTALVTSIKSVASELTYLEISQKYTNGFVFDVSNSSMPEAYPQLKIKRAYRYPEILSSEALLHTFSKLRAQHYSDLHVLDYDISKGFQDIELFLKSESDALLEKGIVKKEIDANGKRALTFWGAIVLTYRAIPPGKNIVGFVSEKKAQKALEI